MTRSAVSDRAMDTRVEAGSTGWRLSGERGDLQVYKSCFPRSNGDRRAQRTWPSRGLEMGADHLLEVEVEERGTARGQRTTPPTSSLGG